MKFKLNKNFKLKRMLKLSENEFRFNEKTQQTSENFETQNTRTLTQKTLG